MKTYTITIFEGKQEIHKANYSFDSLKEATQYKLGLFEGMRLAGANPTGMRVKENKITAKHFQIN